MSRPRNRRLPLDVLTRRTVPVHRQLGRLARAISTRPSPTGPVLSIKRRYRNQYQDDRKNVRASIHILGRLHVNVVSWQAEWIGISIPHSLSDLR